MDDGGGDAIVVCFDDCLVLVNVLEGALDLEVWNVGKFVDMMAFS